MFSPEEDVGTAPRLFAFAVRAPPGSDDTVTIFGSLDKLPMPTSNESIQTSRAYGLPPSPVGVYQAHIWAAEPRIFTG